MAGSFSDTVENRVLSKEFGATNYTAPVTHYVGLSSTDPGEAGAGITEPSTGSYAGQSYTNNTTNWPAASGGSSSNGTAISFPQATAPGYGALVRFWFIKETNGAGALVTYGRLQGAFKYFTVVSATDVFTSTSHGLVDGTPVIVENENGALPTGLSANTTYYIINSTTNTFKLSATLGGSAIDITADGSGTNKIAEDKAQTVNSGTTLTIPIGGIVITLD
jgi:hypothetical protein